MSSYKGKRKRSFTEVLADVLLYGCLILACIGFAVAVVRTAYHLGRETAHAEYVLEEKARESRETVQEEVLPPVSVVQALPAPVEPEEVTLPDPTEPVLESAGTFTVTAYCPCRECCGKWADGITATGTTATQGRTVAVDPKVIGLGSALWFEGAEGLAPYVAEDTGGAIKGNKLDLYFDSHQAALEWGVREREVFVEVGNG